MRFRQPKVPPLMAEGLLRGDALEHRHEFDQLVGGGAELFAEPLEFIGLIAAADAKHEPSMGQRVDHADLRHQPHRVIQRHDDHAAAPLDAAGLAGEPRNHHQRRRANAVVGEMMLGEPGYGKARVLRRLHLLHRVVIHPVRGRAARAISHQVELAEIRGVSRLSWRRQYWPSMLQSQP
jgi:hypothetical protein